MAMPEHGTCVIVAACRHARITFTHYGARVLGHIHTGSGSVPDSSEPYASGRLRVGFAFTLKTTDPPRTVRAHFAVYTLRLLRDRLKPNYMYLIHDICHASLRDSQLNN